MTRFFTATRILVVGWVLFVVYAYPGYMTYDSTSQLAQARKLSPITNWQPPVMAYVWRFTDHIIAGPFPMLVIQSVTFLWGANALLRRLTSDRRAALAAVAVLLAPPILAPMAVIWKDCQMAGFLIAGIAALSSPGRRSQLVGCALVFLATSMRYNAAAATLPVMLALFVWREDFTRWRRYALAFGVWAAITALSFTASSALAQRTEHPFEALALYDLGGIIDHRDDIGDTELAALLDGVPLAHTDAIQTRTRAVYTSDGNSLVLTDTPGIFTTPTTDDQRAAISAAWLRMIGDSPLAYLRHRLGVFLSELRVTHRDTFYIWAGFVDGPWAEDALHVRASHSWLQFRWFRVMSLLSNTPLYWTWLYLVIAIALCWVFRRDRVMVAVLASGILCELALFWVAPSTDYRYSLWMVACSIVGIAGFAVRKRPQAA